MNFNVRVSVYIHFCERAFNQGSNVAFDTNRVWRSGDDRIDRIDRTIVCIEWWRFHVCWLKTIFYEWRSKIRSGFFDGVDTTLWRTHGCGEVVGADFGVRLMAICVMVCRERIGVENTYRDFDWKVVGVVSEKRFFSGHPIVFMGSGRILKIPILKLWGWCPKKDFFIGHPIVCMGGGRITRGLWRSCV